MVFFNGLFYLFRHSDQPGQKVKLIIKEIRTFYQLFSIKIITISHFTIHESLSDNIVVLINANVQCTMYRKCKGKTIIPFQKNMTVFCFINKSRKIVKQTVSIFVY